MNIPELKKLLRDISDARLQIGVVTSVDARGTRSATVRTSGGRSHTRILTCVEDLGIGDDVVLARLQGEEHLIILGRIRAWYDSALSTRGVLAPPPNFSVLTMPGVVYAQWDRWPGEDLSWEVEYSLAGDPYADATSVMITGGSYYFYETTPGTVVYMRSRALRWIGANNLMYSAWSGWGSVACQDWEIECLITELTNESGGVAEAYSVIIIDPDDDRSFTTTAVAGNTNVVGVTIEDIADSASGHVCIAGRCTVQVSGAATRQGYIKTAGVVKKVTSAAVPSPGVFGRVIEGGTDANIEVIIGGAPGGAAVHTLLDGMFHSDTIASLPGIGDMIVGGTLSDWDDLAIGAVGEVLTVIAGRPAWAALVHNLLDGALHPDTTVSAVTQGAMIVGNASLEWDDLVHPAAAGHALVTDATDVLWDQTPTWTGLHTFDAGIAFGGGSGVNAMTVPDNIADALSIEDAGGLEYLRIVSTDAQPAVVFNNGEADVDFRVAASGVTNALFVRGSDGHVGVGTTEPGAELEVSALDSETFQRWFLALGGNDPNHYIDLTYNHIGNAFLFGSSAGRHISFNNSGRVGIGIIMPLAKLHVDQASISAACPVLTLDQADVSEEMIEFISAIGVGNALEAVGGKTLTVTHFIKISLPGALMRYIPCGTIA